MAIFEKALNPFGKAFGGGGAFLASNKPIDMLITHEIIA